MTDLTKEEQELVEAIKIFGGTVSGLKQRRFRFTVKVSIAFGVVLALILGIVCYILFVVVPHMNHNTESAQKSADQANSIENKLAQTELARCKAGNDFRENDRARWEFIINISPPAVTPEEVARLKLFKDYIDDADALKDCSLLETPNTTSTTLATPAT